MDDQIFLALLYTGMFVAGALFLVVPIVMQIRSELRAIRRALERLELIDPD